MVNIRLIFKNMDDGYIKEKVKTYADKRFKNLERYSEHILDGELSVEEVRGRFNLGLVLRVKGTTLRAESVGKDPYAAIDEIKEKIKTQLKRYEEKIKLSGRRKSGNERTLGIETP